MNPSDRPVFTGRIYMPPQRLLGFFIFYFYFCFTQDTFFLKVLFVWEKRIFSLVLYTYREIRIFAPREKGFFENKQIEALIEIFRYAKPNGSRACIQIFLHILHHITHSYYIMWNAVGHPGPDHRESLNPFAEGPLAPIIRYTILVHICIHIYNYNIQPCVQCGRWVFRAKSLKGRTEDDRGREKTKK